MILYDEIIKIYPELAQDNGNKYFYKNSPITLCNDSDGKGDYIEKWEYEKPLPAGMKLGK